MAGTLWPFSSFWMVQVVACSVIVETFWSHTFNSEVATDGHFEAASTPTASACGNLCTGFLSCQSFGYNSGSHTCWLYDHQVQFSISGTAAPGTRYFWRLSPRCPTELNYTLEEGLCYKIDNTNMLIDDARELCRRDGASFFVLDTAAKRDFLMTRMKKPVWVGASDVEVEGVWRWSDGTLVDMSPQTWGPGQPDNLGDQDLACLLLSGQMDDYLSNVMCRVACQILLQ